jgi:hypothetical protein
MKDKIGFNLIFALIAFPIGLALFKDLSFDPFKLKNPALDILYFITFCAVIFFMLKKQNKNL